MTLVGGVVCMVWIVSNGVLTGSTGLLLAQVMMLEIRINILGVSKRSSSACKAANKHTDRAVMAQYRSVSQDQLISLITFGELVLESSQ